MWLTSRHLKGWYSRDSLCYGAGARVVYITAKAKKSKKAKSPLQVHWLSFMGDYGWSMDFGTGTSQGSVAVEYGWVLGGIPQKEK